MPSATATQKFFVEGRYLGSRQIRAWNDRPPFGMLPVCGVALFCPNCGDLWARILPVDATWTQSYIRKCKRHGDGTLSAVPCLFYWQENEFAEDWPPAAIRHEFLTLLEQAERRLGEQATSAR